MTNQTSDLDSVGVAEQDLLDHHFWASVEGEPGVQWSHGPRTLRGGPLGYYLEEA